MGRFTIMKKIIHYMQDQAVHPSPTVAYLSPLGQEPQQRYSAHQSHSNAHNQQKGNHGVSATKPSNSSNGLHTPYPVPTNDLVRHQYASDNILQSYTVYIPPRDSSSHRHHHHHHLGHHQETPTPSQKYWIVYIHGGYYRDPKVTSTSFNPILSNFLHHPQYSSQITPFVAGYASVNYRLSPHPNHPQQPEKTSSYELRNARHPDHINDVLAALADLQSRYKFEGKYILIGHSVGATMALQTALSQKIPWAPPAVTSQLDPTGGPAERTLSTATTLNDRKFVVAPEIILSLNGIHSFPLLHHTNPQYVSMTSNAFGDDDDDDDDDETFYFTVSPTTYPASSFTGLKHLVVAASRHDSLVPWSQVEVLTDLFSSSSSSSVRVQVKELRGDHNDSWKHGDEVARIMAELMRNLS